MEVPALAPAPADYGYAVALLVSVVAILLSVLICVTIWGGRILKGHLTDLKAERDAERKRNDEQHERSEAARAAARQQFDESLRKRGDATDDLIKQSFSELEAKVGVIKDAMSRLGERVVRLETLMKIKPPQEGGE